MQNIKEKNKESFSQRLKQYGVLILKWGGRALLFLLLLFLLLNLIIQIPAIQNWAVKKISKSLSKTLETKVEIDGLSFFFFDELNLEGFYLEDYHQDTLIYSQNLTVDFNSNIISLFRNGLEVEALDLNTARFFLNRYAGELETDFHKALSHLFPSDTTQVAEAVKEQKKPKKPFQMNVKRIQLEDVHFIDNDIVDGKQLSIYLSTGALGLEKLDLPNKKILANYLELNQPHVSVKEYNESPIDGNQALEEEEETRDSTEKKSLQFLIREFHLNEGKFSLRNERKSPVRTSAENVLDYAHLEVFNINIDIDSFSMAALDFRGKLNNFSLQERSGFTLHELSAKDAIVSPTQTMLNGLTLRTPYSEIGDTLIFKYKGFPSYKDFPNKMNITGRLNNAKVALRDIMVFAKGLKKNSFFQANQDQVLKIDGDIRGRINNLRGRNLLIELGNGTKLKGNFSSRNLAVKKEEFLNLRLDYLQTSMVTLGQLIPNFTPPENFNKLGRIDFRGSFDGFFVDFVAKGDLRTDLGQAQMDMRMNLLEGKEKARYGGKISLNNFDLAQWADNPDFGLVSFTSEVKEGIGLQSETASASLLANIQTFPFKGYNYRNAQLEGKLNKNLFDGSFLIQDQNIDFSFIGKLNFQDSVNVFDFNANVHRLALKKLNLSKKDLVLAGKIDLNLRNSKLLDNEGFVDLYDLNIVENSEKNYNIDSIIISSTSSQSGYRVLKIDSDLMEGKLEGFFEIDQIPNAFLQYLTKNYTEFTDRLGIKPPEKDIKRHQFGYDLEIHDTKGLNRLASADLGNITDTNIWGYFSNTSDSLEIFIDMPRFEFGKLEFIDIALSLDALAQIGDLDIAVDSTVIDKNQVFAPIKLLSFINNDTLNFGIHYSNPNPSTLANLNLDGLFYLADSSNFQVRFNQSNLQILENPWIINADNYITFGKNFVETKDFILTNNKRRVSLESIDNKGLKLSLDGFKFGLIDTVWKYDNLDFAGQFKVRAQVEDVFKLQNITASVVSDTLLVNNDDWGAFRFDLEAEDLKHPLRGFMTITKDTSQIVVEGKFNPTNLIKGSKKIPIDQQANYFEFDLDISGYPLNIAEYFIGNTVSNTIGDFDADIRVFGLPKQPNIEGQIIARGGAVTVDYLNTRYTFDRSIIRASNHLFDASGTILKDKYGHQAVIQGGITHNYLKALGLRARLSTERFLGLDTKKGDNKLYYGHAIGKGDVTFSGLLKQIDVYVNATIADSANIVIPISYDREASDLNFIRFVDKNKKEEVEVEVDQEDLRGLSLEMDLSITNEAIMELIFDEQVGDIIKGTGKGNIRIVVPRGRDFQMYGDYTIEQGDYLFTLYNVINKDFHIKQGGIVQWSGDPYGAQIKLEAEYKGLNTAVANFIQEYLVNSDATLKNEASTSTDVSLTMKLQGDLMQPDINFDIAFPSLNGQLESYTDSKIRLLKQDPNEMNRQVFGLIVVGQFLPSDLSFQGSEVVYNTVSEFVSNQLSLMITELFSEFIGDGEVFSGTDFDIAYNQYQSVDLGEGQNISSGNEFQVRLKQDLFNDRVSILVGGNVDFGNGLRATPTTSGTFVGNDLVFEFILNRDRSLKFRLYQSLEPDIGGGRRLEVGAGLSFRKEFNSFGEFIRSFKQSSKVVREPGS